MTPTLPANAPGTQKPLALPTGSDKSGVTSKSVSVPSGSGTIQGMSESFSAQLSTGIATFTVPFALPAARDGAQPALSLSYSSSGGFEVAGVGWSVGGPFIARQTDSGVPRYTDQSIWNPLQDRFVFNGGQELVPICTVGTNGVCSGKQKTGDAGLGQRWQYFRPRVEGSFLRFFWSPDHLTWRVQDKSGVTMELGVPLDGSGYASALERNPDAPPEIYRWHLVRQYDTHGLANPATGWPNPANVVVYRYLQDAGMAYVSDIFDTPPPTESPRARPEPRDLRAPTRLDLRRADRPHALTAAASVSTSACASRASTSRARPSEMGPPARAGWFAAITLPTTRLRTSPCCRASR